MRYNILLHILIYSVCIVGSLSALTPVGRATTSEQEGLKVFTFMQGEEPQVVVNGEAQWYEGSTLVQQGTDYFYPEVGKEYVVHIGDATERFMVRVYSPLQFTNISVSTDCEQTTIHLDAEGGTVGDRNVVITYHTLSWQEKEWVREEKSVTVPWNSTLIVDPSYDYTSYTITEQGTTNSITSEVVTPIKVACQCLTNTTIRSDEPTGEMERPTATTDLSGSAPLEVFFQVLTTPGTEYYTWRIYKDDQFVVQRTDKEHRYTFLDAGNYEVKLLVSSTEGCSDSTSIDISVSESMIKVPNIFTPNGDGINDIFCVEYRSLKEFNMWVFNRWGKEVYSTSNPDGGWDGRVHNKPAPEGAYMYVIRAKGTDAKGNYKSRKKKKPIGVYQLSGTINLIRGE